ncbi:MAG: hypothetical protein CME65_06780 [Halobacteriovoraceae bacterium]|nr:hypothetical protein [Halobacteriovoraceae bacterium]|tara:strand:+ start:476 stop:1114 length:639 start_codon:yes stop_codon:yes gene_type:complete
MKTIETEKEIENTLLAGKHAKYFLHDISNYLTVINASVDLFPHIISGRLSEAKSQDVVKKCKRGLRELNSLCFTYKQTILGRYEPQLQSVNFNTLLEIALEITRDSYPKAKIEIKNTVSDEYSLKADHTLFLQCLVNILKNAVENQVDEKRLISIKKENDSILIANPITLKRVAPQRAQLGMKFLDDSLKLMDINHITQRSKTRFSIELQPS